MILVSLGSGQGDDPTREYRGGEHRMGQEHDHS